MSMEYIRMDETHIADVAHMERLCFTIPWSTRTFEMELKNNVAYYLIALCEGQVVGYGGVWEVAGEGHITNIATHPQYRKMGIGSGILKRLIEYAIVRELCLMTLEVRKSNYAAQRLYEKYGFEPVGERRRYYEDNNEDAIIMTKVMNYQKGTTI